MPAQLEGTSGSFGDNQGLMVMVEVGGLACQVCGQAGTLAFKLSDY